jgi:hypothetical protein
VEEVDAHQLSTWAQPAVDPFQGCCRVADVMQGPGRDDCVEAGLVGNPGGHIAAVVGEPTGPGAVCAPLGELHSARVGVDSSDVVAGLGHRQAERSGAAADVEDPRRRRRQGVGHEAPEPPVGELDQDR